MKAASKDVRMTVEKHGKSGYRPDLHPVLVSFFASEGLTDAQIATKLHISRSILNNWRKGHPELAQALKDSKETADAQVVMSLYHKTLQGDVAACIFFLCNRRPDKWKRTGQVEVHIDAQTGREMSTEEVVRTYTEAFQKAAQKAVEDDSGCTP